MHLATLELETALGLLLERLPNLRRDPAAPAPVITGGSFRTAISLPVVF
jgi:cytochrome P450